MSVLDINSSFVASIVYASYDIKIVGTNFAGVVKYGIVKNLFLMVVLMISMMVLKLFVCFVCNFNGYDFVSSVEFRAKRVVSFF